MSKRSAVIQSLQALVIYSLLILPAIAQNTVTVVNAATFVQFPVAQGGLATAFGNFTGVADGQAQTVPWPTNIDGVRVLVDNVEVPLYFVSARQVNFQVPWNTAIGRRSLRVVTSSGEHTGIVDVLDVSPGIFAGQGAVQEVRTASALNQDNSVNSESNRARRGQVIQLYTTGLGPVNPAVPAGAAPPEGTLPANARAPKVWVSVGEAQVQFAGLSPQFPGVWQVNAVVPDRLFIAGEVPVVIVADGIESNTVKIWVAE